MWRTAPFRDQTATSVGSLSSAASKLHRRVSRLDAATAEKQFPPEQRAQWPTDYLPASGVAHLLRPGGVPFADIVSCHQELREDRQQQLQRDFASDYTLWLRCTLRDYIRQLDEKQRRQLRRFTAWERTLHDAEVRSLFHLQPYAPPAPVASSPSPYGSIGGEGSKYYQPTPYAAGQAFAMLPVANARSPHQRIQFSTFPQVRNVLYSEYDFMGPLQALAMYSGDALVWTREGIQALAWYIRRRVEAILATESSFLSQAPPLVTEEGAAPTPPTFSRRTPVVCFFGNGRLAWLLNDTGILSFKIQPVQLPAQRVVSERRYKQLVSRDACLPEARAGLHESFGSLLPCETLSVGDALRRYRPCMALVEPHLDRDWFADLRGYHSVREVLALGQIDSPAMGSLAFPFLSWGVMPGPTTYTVYNDQLSPVTASKRIQMPMDPPHVTQGYERRHVYELSAYMLGPRDSYAVGRQYQALAFVRTSCPKRCGPLPSQPTTSPSPQPSETRQEHSQ